jgi:DNA polymerase III alpha subunit
MKRDGLGRCYTDCNGLTQLLYENPDLDLSLCLVQDARGVGEYASANSELYAGMPQLQEFQDSTQTIEEFDAANQQQWRMPPEYQSMDIAKWCLDQCSTQAQLQRVGQELMLFQDRNLFDLLRYLKYLVDTMRMHRVLWGVGRGSSVASYVLYVIGIHRVDSLYYNLDITEFLK